jgi:hypothetical protein
LSAKLLPREEEGKIERVLADAAAREIHEKAQEDTIAAEAANQANNLPLTRYEWIEHLESGLKPTISYIMSRFKSGGDRYEQVELYRAARICDPLYAKGLTTGRAMTLIDKLQLYHPLNNNAIIKSLKASWKHYKAKACAMPCLEEVLFGGG